MSDTRVRVLPTEPSRPPRSRTGLLWAPLLAASVVLGAMAGQLARGDVPALALLLPLLIVPFVLWKYPVLGVYLLFAGVVTIEQFGYEVGPRNGAVTAAIPLLQGVLPAGANPAEILMGLTLIIVIMQAVRNREHWFHRSPVAGAMAATVGVAVGYFFVGMNRGGDLTMALWEVRPYLYLFITFILASALITRIDSVRPLLWILVLGSGVKAAYGMAIFLSVRTLQPRPEAVLAHEESFFFGLYLLATAALWLFGIKGRLRVVATVIMPLVLATDMANSRRTAWLILMTGMAVLLLVAFVRLRERRKGFIGLGMVLIAGMSVYLPAFWNSDSTIAQPARAVRSAIAPDPRDDSSNEYRRIEDYNLMRYIDSTRSTGYGFGRPLEYSGLVDLTEENPLLAYVPHNNVLYVWLRTGIWGLALFAFLLSQALISAVRLAAAHKREVAMVGALAASAVFAYASMGVTDMGFFWFRNAIAIGILLGVVDGLRRTYLSRPDVSDSYSAPVSHLVASTGGDR